MIPISITAKVLRLRDARLSDRARLDARDDYRIMLARECERGTPGAAEWRNILTLREAEFVELCT